MSLPIGSRFTGVRYRITPSGNAATDTAAFESLLVALPATGGVIEIADNGVSLVLSPQNSTAVNSNGVIIRALYPGAVNIYKPVFICGETTKSRLQLNPGYILCWGGSDAWWEQAAAQNVTHGTWSGATAAGSTQIANSSISLTRGDWVLVYANDSIPDVNPHSAGGTQRPASLHRVEYNYATVVNSVTTIYNVIDGHMPDVMTSTPRIIKINMLRNCGIANLTVGSNMSPDLSSTPSGVTQAFRVFGCYGFRVEDVYVDDTSVGELNINASADTVISNYSGLSVPRSSTDYALVVQAVNGLIYQDSFWHNARHVVTTGGSGTNGTLARYGNPLAVTVRNVTCYHGGNNAGSTLSAFDTHPEGYGVTFESCRVFSGGRHISQGFSSRARRTTFRNCEFVSGTTPAFAATAPRNENKGFVISGSRSLIDGCRVQGSWQGVVYTTQLANSFQHDHLLRNTTFDGVTSNPVYCVSPMNNITVERCHMQNSATQYNGDEQTPQPDPIVMGALINLRGGTGHRVYGNVLDRGTNTYSLAVGALTTSDLIFEGNHVRGYTATYSSGTNKIGVRGDTGDPKGVSTASGPSFQSTYSARNYTS